jgi:hypothetical protein
VNRTLKSAWDLEKWKELKIRVIGDNLFVMQFACFGDWEKVMEGGPCVFYAKSVLMALYDGFHKAVYNSFLRVRRGVPSFYRR